MSKPNLVQRLFLKHVVGDLNRIEYTWGGLFEFKEIVLYEVIGEDGKVYHGARYGHPILPKSGDKVEMTFYRSDVFITTSVIRYTKREPWGENIRKDYISWKRVKDCTRLVRWVDNNSRKEGEGEEFQWDLNVEGI